MKITMKETFRGLTGAAAVLAAALGLNLVGPHRAYAAPNALAAADTNQPAVSILSPDPQMPLAGLKPVEISAFYQGSPANQIVAIELFIDGTKAATKTLDAPETRGVVSFLVDAAQIPAGTHRLVLRVTAADQEVASAKSLFTFSGTESSPVPLAGHSPTLPTSPALSSGLPPVLRLISPTSDGRVQGTITLRVNASDPSGKAPYVSLFIDKTFKTLRNYAPYEFEWDTTAYSNGYHTIEAYGYNDTTSVGQAKALRLYVNNPGGETQIRRDLLDGAVPAKPSRVAAPPEKRIERPLPLRRPEVKASAARKMAEKKAEKSAEKKAAAQMASLLPSPHRTTAEIVRQLVAEAGALHFVSPGYDAVLSTPFAAEKPLPMSANRSALLPPLSLLAASLPPLTLPKDSGPKDSGPKDSGPKDSGPKDSGPETAAQAAVTSDSLAPAAAQPAPPTLTASIRLPDSDLASPFVAVPHAAPLTAPTIEVGAYRAELRNTHITAIRPVMRVLMPLKTAVNLHTTHIRLPQSMHMLLRSVGQKTLLFNSATVTMDRPLTNRSSVLFGPLRQIFEQGGGSLTWQASTGTVHARRADQDILLKIGDNHAQVNAKRVTLDGKPYLMMGRTMVPLSFIAVALNASVQFDPATGHLLVTSK